MDRLDRAKMHEASFKKAMIRFERDLVFYGKNDMLKEWMETRYIIRATNRMFYQNIKDIEKEGKL